MPTPSGTTIRIDTLTKEFPATDGGVTKAVDGVSLTIEAGELFFLLGPSGCGKTTLLRMVAGFIDPTAGRIVFADASGERDVTTLAPNLRNTGMVFQSYALWPHMTVLENVAFGLRVRKVPGDERRRRAFDALASVQMETYADRKPNQLSGGQQQRVALARALVIRPSVLLLDEPLSNLDAKLRNELRSEIRRICKGSGTTGVYVTHDQKEALSMADRIAIMRSGRVVQTGTPAGMYRRPADRFVAEFLGETNLIPATVVSCDDGRAVVSCAAGQIVSRAAPPGSLAIGANVLVSLRPEALHLTTGQGENVLPGSLAETTFLGETAQHVFRLRGGTSVKLAQLNPLGAEMRADSATGVRVAPEDAVLLPA